MQYAAQLTDDRIQKYAPAAATRQPQEHLSDKYAFISTLDVVDMLRGEGWYPSFARQSRVNKEENNGFQKHIIRMRHPNHNRGKEFIEIVIVNSYNGKASFQFLIGVFRVVCTNGMIAGETFDAIKVKHIGLTQDHVINASHQILETTTMIMGAIDMMKSVSLNSDERRGYAKSALQLMYDEPEKESPISALDLLVPRRTDDNRSDLWTTFNVVQENVTRGGINGRSMTSGRRIKTRPIKSIDKDVRLNRALWTLTEEMAKIKAA